MKIVKFLLLVFAFILVCFLLVGLALPKEYSMERSATMKAPPIIAFGQVNDLRLWEGWNPWLEMEPDMALSYGARTVGEGASYSWVGEKTGSGSLTIKESRVPERIETELLFEGQNPGHGSFTFAPEAGGTRVTWGMSGRMSGIAGGYMAKLMPLFLGAQFDQGLHKLGEAAEAEAARKTGVGSALEQVLKQAGQELGVGLGAAAQEAGKAVQEAGKRVEEAGQRVEENGQ